MFQRFYADLLEIKAIAETRVVSTQAAAAGGSTSQIVAVVPATDRAASIRNQVLALLEQQVIEAHRAAGPIGVQFHRDALYVMTALADEIFVHLEWEGRDYWLANLLEARLFKSQAAGEIVFARIETLLAEDDEASVETASVYLMAIALGFRGRFAIAGDQAALDSYRTRLFGFLSRRRPDLAAPMRRLFPEAYRHAVEGATELQLPAVRYWLIAIGGAVVLWLAASYIAWGRLTQPLNELLDRLPKQGLMSSPAPSLPSEPLFHGRGSVAAYWTRTSEPRVNYNSHPELQHES
jgi:type VI secretion system protein ImpK